jgi:hypothetical protein
MFSNVLEIDGYKIYYVEIARHPFKLDKNILAGLSPDSLVRVFYKNSYYEAPVSKVICNAKPVKGKYIIEKEHFVK